MEAIDETGLISSNPRDGFSTTRHSMATDLADMCG